MPGTSGFVGEFLTLLGTFKVNTAVATIATLGVILSAAYALWLYRKMIFGVLDKPKLNQSTTWTHARSHFRAARGADLAVRLLAQAGAGYVVGLGGCTDRAISASDRGEKVALRSNEHR